MAKKYSHPDGGYGFDGAGFAMDKASQLGNFLGQHLKHLYSQYFHLSFRFLHLHLQFFFLNEPSFYH